MLTRNARPTNAYTAWRRASRGANNLRGREKSSELRHISAVMRYFGDRVQSRVGLSAFESR